MLKLRYLTVLALAALSAPALAQNQDTTAAPPAPTPVACSTIAGTLGGQSQAPTTSYYGEGEYGYQPDKSSEPKPANPVRKSCDNGKVRMLVGITSDDGKGNPASHRHFGHTIMDKVPLTIVLDVDPSVTIDMTSLVKQRVIGFEGSDWELYKPTAGEPPAVTVEGPVLKTFGTVPDPANPGQKIGVQRKVYVIKVIVQSMVYKPGIPFVLDLRYAYEMLPDGKSPNWKTMSTPDFLVTRSNVADNGEELLEGDISQKAERLPWPTITALSLGVFLMLFFPGLAVVKWLNRVRPRKVIPANRMAWIVFEANHADGKKNGFKVKHLKAFSHALRRYLSTTPNYPRIDALTIEQIATHFPDADQAQLEAVKRAVTTCENEVFASGAERNGETPVSLNDAELHQLFLDLSTLVPRPWDAK